MKNINTLSGLSVVNLSKQIDGEEATLYTLCNEVEAKLAITNYGTRIASLMVPDKNGKMTDVVADRNSIEEHLTSEGPYFGTICGRYGSRIVAGKFTTDGIIYDKLAINNGPNSLHGGIKGFNVVVWNTKQTDEQTAELKYTFADGREDFPGELKTTVAYHLANENEVTISYQASTDKLAVLDLTNHFCFNLFGTGDPCIGDHILTINAGYYLPTDNTAVPYGSKEKIEDTPMDFRTPHEVDERVDDNFKQLVFGKGYDHTYMLNKGDNELPHCVRCPSPKTGIIMETCTTRPGMQLYTGNWMTGNFEGKNGQCYPERAVLCLGTWHFPDSPNEPGYPTTELRPDEVFQSTTVYKFSIE